MCPVPLKRDHFRCPIQYLHKRVHFLPAAVISHFESHFILLFPLHPQNPYTPTLSICRRGRKEFHCEHLALFPCGSQVTDSRWLTVWEEGWQRCLAPGSGYLGAQSQYLCCWPWVLSPGPQMFSSVRQRKCLTASSEKQESRSITNTGNCHLNIRSYGWVRAARARNHTSFSSLTFRGGTK